MDQGFKHNIPTGSQMYMDDFSGIKPFGGQYTNKSYSGSDQGFSNQMNVNALNNRLNSSNAIQNYMDTGYNMAAFPSGNRSTYENNRNPAPAPDGGNKYFTADNINAFGSAITGLGSLASGWAALKNIGIQKDALANQNQQWQTNYESQRTATNNQISNQNAFKKAQGRTDYGSYVGGKPTGTNYV